MTLVSWLERFKPRHSTYKMRTFITSPENPLKHSCFFHFLINCTDLEYNISISITPIYFTINI